MFSWELWRSFSGYSGSSGLQDLVQDVAGNFRYRITGTDYSNKGFFRQDIMFGNDGDFLIQRYDYMFSFNNNWFSSNYISFFRRNIKITGRVFLCVRIRMALLSVSYCQLSDYASRDRSWQPPFSISFSHPRCNACPWHTLICGSLYSARSRSWLAKIRGPYRLHFRLSNGYSVRKFYLILILTSYFIIFLQYNRIYKQVNAFIRL